MIIIPAPMISAVTETALTRKLIARMATTARLTHVQTEPVHIRHLPATTTIPARLIYVRAGAAVTYR